ncbi:Uncharacterized protein SCF082_LOCUS51433 [Durusdinium trenchii]|uniref:Uncharacterized protein n=1 Tax=Durusdinium trenchii TaxID=1381693 RepID=A0ABP0SED0_9DINO
MTKAGHDAQKDWEEHHIRKLDALTVLKDRQAIKDFRRGQHNKEPPRREWFGMLGEAEKDPKGVESGCSGVLRQHQKFAKKLEAGHAECAFNILEANDEETTKLRKPREFEGIKRTCLQSCLFVDQLEAFVSVVGMGDDINGVVRTCPPPRDGESEKACQVDASILVAWVGNAAAKISLAASNCALSLNVDSVCAAGVTGLVAAFGEISAGACLGAAVCTPTPPSLTTTKISVLGDQTVRTPEAGRRLLIGEGPVGNGVQCGVDVGLAINKAVNVNRCGKFATEKNPLNVLKGIPDALCTVDIAGAVAYISQVVTFINLIVDFLDVSALCGGSIAAITTGGAAIAAYGGAVHAACRYNHLLKTPKPTQKVAEWRKAVAKINELYTLPDPLHRRLEAEEEQRPLEELQFESLKIMNENKMNLQKHLAHFGMNISSTPSYTQADKESSASLLPKASEPVATEARRSCIEIPRVSSTLQTFYIGSWPVKKTLCVAGVLLAVVGLGSLRFSNQCLNLDALQGKSEAQMDEALLKTRKKLLEVKNRSLAEKTILKAMQKAGHDAQKDWEEHHIRKLDTLTVLKDRQAIKDFRRGQHNKEAGHAECAFNILEAFVSVVGMGDDINGIVRTCPPPRDGESELACQVDASILVAWVGNAAAKISLAASNCALSLNVDSVCAAGVTGLVAAFGEISAGACLGAAVCTPTPPSLTTTKISVLGDQTVRTPEAGRRLLIGEGPVGNGVQCGVDVGMVAANIANIGLAINKAVNVNRCGKFATEKNPLNVLKGIPDALCTVDIAGAVAYISQVVTFINLIVVHCQDFLDVSALCGGSIAAITTGGAAIAAYGGAVHAACRYNHLLKTPKAVAKINELYTLPDPLHRRLEAEEQEEQMPLEESLKIMNQNKLNLQKHLGHLGMNISHTQSYTQADKETFLRLMEGGLDTPRAAGPFQEC